MVENAGAADALELFVVLVEWTSKMLLEWVPGPADTFAAELGMTPPLPCVCSTAMRLRHRLCLAVPQAASQGMRRRPRKCSPRAVAPAACWPGRSVLKRGSFRLLCARPRQVTDQGLPLISCNHCCCWLVPLLRRGGVAGAGAAGLLGVCGLPAGRCLCSTAEAAPVCD